MSTAGALLSQQPIAFWMAATALLLAAGLASGRPLAVVATLASVLGAIVAAAAPQASVLQAAAAVTGAASTVALTLRPGRRAAAFGAPPQGAESVDDALAGDVRLLGRTARTCAPFVRGDGEVEVDGAARAARALAPDEFLDGGVRVRIVRVGDGALGVRPLATPRG